MVSLLFLLIFIEIKQLHMSKTSAKQRYMQLMEWLPTVKQGKASTPGSKAPARTFSKADTYNRNRK